MRAYLLTTWISARLARRLMLPVCGLLALGCVQAEQPGSLVPAVVEIPAGAFISGSDRTEREFAYTLDEVAYGHQATRTRGWYEREAQRGESHTRAYSIVRTPVTNAQYAAFVKATGHRVPAVSAALWASFGVIHPFERTRQFAWSDGVPPSRGNHPVVLVSREDAEAYARWLSQLTGQKWRLPSELEWEKAARGTDGRYFPWGNDFDAALLNSHDAGPFTTTDVGTFTAGGSPFGMLDAAGQVFEWTSDNRGETRGIVKGGSWDDKGCGVCRPAARHARPVGIKHILIGFRVIRE